MKIQRLSHNAFKICFNATKGYTLLFMLLFFIQAVLPSILTILEATFINEVLSQLLNGESSSLVISYAIVILALITIKWEMGSLQQFVSNLMVSKVKMDINNKIYEKKSKILYECFENKEISDLIFLTSDEPEKKIVNCVKNKMMLITDIVTVSTFIIILFPILSLKIWFLLFLIIPLLIISVKSGQKSYDINKKLMFDKRKSNNYFDMLNSKESADERNTFHYSKSINETSLQLNEVMRHKEMKVRFKWFLRLKSSAIIIALFTGILTIDMFYSVVSKTLSMGMFISMFNALNSLIGTMTWQITELTDKIAKDNALIKDYNQFFKLPEKDHRSSLQKDFDSTTFETLVLRNVSFSYPNSNINVLENFSFTFVKGKKYSLIGINGSGKSTLIKLLLGLYSNYTGVIEINGIDIRDLKESELRNLFSVVFQDFVQYQLSIDEIMSLVDSSGLVDKDKVYQQMQFSDLINALPKGSKTEIGKIYNSNIDLSYGQWQKLNIVKSLIKQAPIYILDEPTASLDPLSELEIYRQYLNAKANETLIMISHRLGITKNADIIVLLDKGKVVATGNHADLYEESALYKEMFDLQKEWYNYENN